MAVLDQGMWTAEFPSWNLKLSGAAVNGISRGSTCLCLLAEASAQAEAFLSNLRKMSFDRLLIWRRSIFWGGSISEIHMPFT